MSGLSLAEKVTKKMKSITAPRKVIESNSVHIVFKKRSRNLVPTGSSSVSYVTFQYKSKIKMNLSIPGNPCRRETLRRVDLLIKIGCFENR